MHIVIVGPTHPYKGGVAQHTTVLARTLHEAGHHVEVVSWKSQYPRLLYPGVQHVTGPPEIEPIATTRRRLHWARPWTWISEARRLRGADLVVLAHVTPIQVPAYWVLLRHLQWDVRQLSATTCCRTNGPLCSDRSSPRFWRAQTWC